MGHFRRAFASLLVLVSACAACAPTPQSAAQTHANDPVQDLKSKTVALVEQRPIDGPFGGLLGLVENHVYCSGVWVDQNTIVTANHCMVNFADDSQLEPGAKLLYSTQSDVDPSDDDAIKTVHGAELLAIDPEHDLALVRVSAPPAHESAPLAQSVYVGERDATMGHPLDLLWSYSEGLVSAIRKTADPELDILWIQSTAPISPGNSGGGLFNERGELMGICSRGYFGRAENLNFYVHVDYVRALLTVAQKQ